MTQAITAELFHNYLSYCVSVDRVPKKRTVCVDFFNNLRGLRCFSSRFSSNFSLKRDFSFLLVYMNCRVQLMFVVFTLQ